MLTNVDVERMQPKIAIFQITHHTVVEVTIQTIASSLEMTAHSLKTIVREFF